MEGTTEGTMETDATGAASPPPDTMDTMDTMESAEAPAYSARVTSSLYDVINELEPTQLSAVRYSTHYGRQTLRPLTVAILWLLRAYVVLMVIIVVAQVWAAVHGGGQ